MCSIFTCHPVKAPSFLADRILNTPVTITHLVGDIDIEGGLVCLQIYELVCEKYIFNSEFYRNKTYFKNLIYRVSTVTALLEYSANLPTDREENNDVALNLGKAGSYAKEIKEIEKWESQERKRVSISCSCCFPDCWKVSSVVHVFKNIGERSAAKNYRPDSKVTVCFCHVTYAFQSESTLYSCLNVKELLARIRREI